jgi:hypothetical protein
MLFTTWILFLPQSMILICFPVLISSSAITWRQLPQGEMHSAVSPSSVIAAIAMATGLSSG